MRGRACGTQNTLNAALLSAAACLTLFACRPSNPQQNDRTIQPASIESDATTPAAANVAAHWPATKQAVAEDAAKPTPGAGAEVVADAAPELEVPDGLDGAALLLQTGDPTGALARLAELPAPSEGSDSWFRHQAIRGRAARLAGQHAESVKAYEALVAHKKLDRHVPTDHVLFELALSLEALANSGALERAQADARRRDAVKHLSRARKHKRLRNLAELRVVQARILAEIEGSGGASTRVAANKAVTALDRVISEYPNCPHVGELELLRARARLRAGKTSDAATELRSIAMTRAGEPEAEEAWRELTALAERDRKVQARPWSRAENLRRAEYARSLRHVDLSRQLLDEIVDDDSTPLSVRRQALRSRAWTSYKQKDYATCVHDWAEVYEQAGGIELRDNLIRCLERDAQYERAIELHLERAGKKGMIGKQELWAAIGVAVRGGLYERAAELLKRFENQYRAYQSERRWLDAWLKMRLDKRDQAIAAFAEVERRVRSMSTQARYFRGKLLLKSQDAEARAEGEGLLRNIASRKPLSYYGLQARQRLLDAGVTVTPPPAIDPMPDESKPLDYVDARAAFDALSQELGDASEALTRAAALHGVGYVEEARREYRIATDEFLTSGRKSGGYTPRNEDYIAGLGWKASWKMPKARASGKARKLFRQDDVAARVRENLRTLARALDEPYRLARLTPSVSFPYQSRWHPRAFRPVLEREAEVRGLDPNHLWALMYTESRFRRHVVSAVGARGALQIMPWTGRQLAERLGEYDGRFDFDTLFEIDTNARLATYYVSELMAKFHGQSAMAYASYNGGPFNVSRWLAAKADPARGQSIELDEFIEEIPFRETGRYTRRVLEVKAAYDLLYKGELPRWTNAVDPEFEDNINF